MVRDRATVRGRVGTYPDPPGGQRTIFPVESRAIVVCKKCVEVGRTSSLAGMCRGSLNYYLFHLPSWDLEKSRVTLRTETFSLGVQYCTLLLAQ
jgi:hypothetical protein